MEGLLRRMTKEGERAALAAFGVPSQPGLGSVGMAPPKAPGLPSMKPPSVPKTPGAPTGGASSLGLDAAKVAFNVGMGASNSTSGAGAQASEPVDTARRQRSVIDRAFQRNEDDYASSSMPLPGAVVAP